MCVAQQGIFEFVICTALHMIMLCISHSSGIFYFVVHRALHMILLCVLLSQIDLGLLHWDLFAFITGGFVFILQFGFPHIFFVQFLISWFCLLFSKVVLVGIGKSFTPHILIVNTGEVRLQSGPSLLEISLLRFGFGWSIIGDMDTYELDPPVFVTRCIVKD